MRSESYVPQRYLAIANKYFTQKDHPGLSSYNERDVETIS